MNEYLPTYIPTYLFSSKQKTRSLTHSFLHSHCIIIINQFLSFLFFSAFIKFAYPTTTVKPNKPQLSMFFPYNSLFFSFGLS